MDFIPYKFYKYLMGFRSGRNDLNAQSKFRIDKKCIHLDCDILESTMHYLLECKYYKNERNIR